MKIDDKTSAEAVLVELGTRVRHARVTSRLKQEELSARSGISRAQLIRLERGDNSVKLQTLIAVLRTLRLLHLLETALPSVELSPLQVADLELRKKRMPMQVRERKSKTSAVKSWGDGTKIGG